MILHGVKVQDFIPLHKLKSSLNSVLLSNFISKWIFYVQIVIFSMAMSLLCFIFYSNLRTNKEHLRQHVDNLFCNLRLIELELCVIE